LISKDRRQAKREAERQSILAHKIVAFYLAPKVEKMRVNEQAAIILWHLDRIIEQRKLNENGLFVLPENKRSKFRAL